MTQLESQYNQRACPCCGCSDRAYWTLSSNPPAEESDFANLKACWTGFFHKRLFFTYEKCPSCKTVYCGQYFTEEQLQQLYGSMDDNTAGLDSTFLAEAQGGYYEIIKGFLKGKGDYLELGPDIGLFTRKIVENENFGIHWLVEPNVRSHEALAQVCDKKKHVIKQSSYDIDEIQDGSLSLVVMIHVLDHLLRPRELLQKIQSKMREGGVIAIVIHDQSSLLASMLKRRWPAYCLQHPQVFSPLSITKLFVLSGLHNTKIVKTYNFFPFNYLVKHFFYALGFRRFNVDFLPQHFVKIKLGNMVAVSFKKTS